MRYWTSIPQKLKPITYTLSEGINQAVESLELSEGQAVSVVNLDSFESPTLSVRDGFTLYGEAEGYINRLFMFKGVLYYGNGKGLYKRNGNAWDAVYEYTNTNNNRLWDAAQFFDGSKLYFVNDDLQLQEYDGSTLNALTDAPAGSAFLTTHANRFYLANRNDNNLSYSALRDASDWSDVDEYVGSGTIVVESEDGELPTGLTNFADHVILFKRYTMHELFGEDSTNFTMANPYPYGCISDRSIVVTKYGLFFLGPDGVYLYQGGNAPQKISDPVKKYIEYINMEHSRHCVAGSDGRFLYVSLVTGTSTLPNVTLKYDMEYRTWWVENYVATAYFLDGQTFYVAIGSNIYTKGGNDDNGNPIEWEWVSKPFTEGDEISKKSLHKLWLVADIEESSSVNVYYSADSEGDNWILAKSIQPTGRLQNIRIPLIVKTPSEWFRIKISGQGKAKFHRLVREVARRGV